MKYCVIEGIKGSGKSTTLKQIRQSLQDQQIPYQELNPTHPPTSFTWREWLHKHTYLSSVDSWREGVYAHRARFHSKQVDWTQNTPLLLGDRSIYTSLVTRWHRTQSLGIPKYIDSVLKKEHPIPIPDYVFYLDLPLEEVQTRLHTRQRDYGLHDETPQRLQEALDHYQFLSNYQGTPFNQTQWISIQAQQSPEQVAQEIVNYLLPLLST